MNRTVEAVLTGQGNREAVKTPTEPRLSVLPADPVEEALKDKGFYLLPRGTRVGLKVKYSAYHGTSVVTATIGVMQLEHDLEVKDRISNSQPAQHILPPGSGTIVFAPDSEHRRDAQRTFDDHTQPGRDIMDLLHRLQDAESSLAKAFLQGKESLIRYHGIDPEDVVGVELRMGVSRPLNFNKPK